jgi:hypothetical protein
MKSRMTPRKPSPCAQKTVNGLGSGGGGLRAGICETCLSEMKPGSRGETKRFCSASCRRLAWSVRMLVEALTRGRADGLRERICEIGRRLG